MIGFLGDSFGEPNESAHRDVNKPDARKSYEVTRRLVPYRMALAHLRSTRRVTFVLTIRRVHWFGLPKRIAEAANPNRDPSQRHR